MMIGDPGSAANLYRLSHSKNVRLLGHLFFEVHRSRRSVLILLLRIFTSDQKQKSKNCVKFADVKYLVLNVDSREEKNALCKGGRKSTSTPGGGKWRAVR